MPQQTAKRWGKPLQLQVCSSIKGYKICRVTTLHLRAKTLHYLSTKVGIMVPWSIIKAAVLKNLRSGCFARSLFFNSECNYTRTNTPKDPFPNLKPRCQRSNNCRSQYLYDLCYIRRTICLTINN